MLKTAFSGGFLHFMWLFSRARALWRTLVRLRLPDHAFCTKISSPCLTVGKFCASKTFLERKVLDSKELTKSTFKRWGILPHRFVLTKKVLDSKELTKSTFKRWGILPHRFVLTKKVLDSKELTKSTFKRWGIIPRRFVLTRKVLDFKELTKSTFKR